jgi:hypothetical protein
VLVVLGPAAAAAAVGGGSASASHRGEWLATLSADVPELEALAQRWERGELGGQWLRMPREEEDDEDEGEEEGGGEAAAAAGAAAAAAAELRTLYETGLGPGLPPLSRRPWPGDVPAAWFELLAAPTAAAAAGVARRMGGAGAI